MQTVTTALTIIAHKDSNGDNNSVVNELFDILERTFLTGNNLIYDDTRLHQEDHKSVKAVLSGKTYDNIFVVSTFEYSSLNSKETTDLVAKYAKRVHYLGNTNNSWQFWLTTAINMFGHISKTDVVPTNFKYSFMCYNRILRDHRSFMLEEIISYGLDQCGIITACNGKVCCDLSITPKLVARLPIRSKYDDCDVIDNQIFNDVVSLGNLNVWNSTFLCLVTETVASEMEHIFLSEKVFKPIIGMRPFILLGSPGILQRIKELGFRTFSDWFNEEYDSYSMYDYRRYKSVILILQQIAKMTGQERAAMYHDMYPTLEHNRKIIEQLYNTQPTIYNEIEQIFKV